MDWQCRLLLFPTGCLWTENPKQAFTHRAGMASILVVTQERYLSYFEGPPSCPLAVSIASSSPGSMGTRETQVALLVVPLWLPDLDNDFAMRPHGARCSKWETLTTKLNCHCLQNRRPIYFLFSSKCKCQEARIQSLTAQPCNIITRGVPPNLKQVRLSRSTKTTFKS